MLNLLGVIILFVVASISPYSSAMGVNLEFARSPEEVEISKFTAEKTAFIPKESLVVNLSLIYIELDFADRLLLKPQTIPEAFHKPPSA